MIYRSHGFPDITVRFIRAPCVRVCAVHIILMKFEFCYSNGISFSAREPGLTRILYVLASLDLIEFLHRYLDFNP